MSKYCISYDLNENHKDYDGLISAIKDYNYIKALYSTWFVKSNDTAQMGLVKFLIYRVGCTSWLSCFICNIYFFYFFCFK